MIQLDIARPAAAEDADELPKLVYAELRVLAARYLRRERAGGGTFDPTELVNECFIRLYQTDQSAWSSRAHFFGVAARSMRQILVDRARRRAALKRPDGRMKLSLDDALEYSDDVAWQLVELNEALKQLETFDPMLCRIVELRFFAGLSVEQIAEILATSVATVRRNWSLARAWLHRALS